MTPRVRVGVAGLGFGAAVHVPGFRRIPGVEIVAIAGRDHVRASRTALALEIPVGVDSIEALLAEGVDAISLALPPSENAVEAAFGVAHGVPVLCEKPLSLDPVEARTLADAAANVTNAVDFQFAELDAFLQLRVLVSERTLGVLQNIRITWLTESYAHRTQKWSWKTDLHQGGGVMTLLGTHLLYLLEWLCGPVVRLAGARYTMSERRFAPPGCMAADDTAQLEFELGSGAHGTARLSNAHQGPPAHCWELTFDRGIAVLRNDTTDHMRGFKIEIREQDRGQIFYEDTSHGGEDDRLFPFVRLATRFIASVRTGEIMRPSFVDGARVAFLGAQVKMESAVAASAVDGDQL